MIEKTFNTGSITLNYAEGEPNGPPLLLIPGLGSRWQSFYYLIPRLSENWHLFALDPRGHGKSERARSYKIQDCASDVAYFIENCIKLPTAILGHSQGGMTAILTAASNPELVKALVLGDSIISLPFLKEFSELHRPTTVFWRNLAKTQSLEFIMSELKNQLIPVTGQAEPVPAHRVYGDDNPYFQFMAECFSRLDPEVFTADIDNFDETYGAYQTDKLFPMVRCPVLLLQANRNLGGLMRDEDVDTALKLLPKAQHVRITNAGHMVIVQDTDSVLNAVVSFLNSLS